MGLASWKNGCTILPNFEPCLTLGRVKSSVPHRAWRFHFFHCFWSKIRVHQDLHINCLDFFLMKK
jgi:hypothetical protein